MKYFIDTEFIEGFKKPLFGKKRHFIDLISIGIKAEDGREYYAISNEFNPKDADRWVKDNVISKLYDEDGLRLGRWISNKQIAQEISSFIAGGETMDSEISFYAYYADYDWVVFCSLFGRMIDLPKCFPMYCRDLKQMIDEQVSNLKNTDFFQAFHIEKELSFGEKLNLLKKHVNYPKQENEHSALDDAKWNFELYKFLKTL